MTRAALVELVEHVQDLESAMQDANPGWRGPALWSEPVEADPAPRSEDLGDPIEVCGCEEAVGLRAQVAELAKQCDTWAATVAEKNRRLGNLAASHDLPRGPDVARIYALEQAIDAAVVELESAERYCDKDMAGAACVPVLCALSALRAARSKS